VECGGAAATEPEEALTSLSAYLQVIERYDSSGVSAIGNALLFLKLDQSD
jgi:hypothetical protein